VRVTVLIKVLIVVFGCLAGLNVVFSTLDSRAKSDLTYAYEMQHAFLSATYSFSEHSMALTRYARVFAVHSYAETGDIWATYRIYNELREHDVRVINTIMLFARNGALTDEINMIINARALFNEMREMEDAAFDAVKYSDTRIAMNFMFGEELNEYIVSFNALLYELNALMLPRKQSSIDEALGRTTRYNRMMTVITALLTLTSISGVVYLVKIIKIAVEHESEVVKAAKQEENLRAIAEEESHAKTKFLARMSHEIRTPMNAVLGIAEIELMKSFHPPETEEAFSRIHNSSKLLLSVINDILDLSKVEAGKMEIVPAPYDITRMIMDTALLNIMHKGEKNIEFRMDVNENLPVSLIGDELRIKQVLNNFLSNAFKYTAEGTVTLAVGKVGITGDGKEITLILTVSDTGQGMTTEEISRLFDSEYTRYNVQTNRAVEGTGLGMSIARQLITMMNGKVTAKSSVGEGSTFIIKIPQVAHGDALLGAEAAENLWNMKITPANNFSSLENEPMPYGKVLVVDDIESNLYVIEGYLTKYQIQIEMVLSGQEAIDKVKAGNTYDIIFMDHMMPDLDGLETTKILRDMGYTSPIVALTANTIKGAKELFMSNGFTGFISKPIDLSSLNSLLTKHIRDKQPPDVIEAAKKSAVLNATAPSSGKTELSEKIVNSFLRDAKKAVEIMQQTLELDPQSITPPEIKNFAIQAHGMKSALANIGRNELSLKAKFLEDSANENDMQAIFSQIEDFIGYVQAIVEELAPPESSADSDIPDSDPELLSAQLKIMAEACDIYDKKTANNALKTLKELKWSAKTQALIYELEVKLLRAEFEDAVEMINSFQ